LVNRSCSFFNSRTIPTKLSIECSSRGIVSKRVTELRTHKQRSCKGLKVVRIESSSRVPLVGAS
jgi:hypothetical protein